MRRIVLDDFSGGIAPANGFVTDRQVAEASGLVLRNSRSLSTQWPMWKPNNGKSRLENPDIWFGDNFQLVSQYGDDPVDVQVGARVCGRIRWKVDGEFRPAWVLRYSALNGQPARMVLALGGGEVIDGLPTFPRLDDEQQPVGGVLPRANHACMWDDFVVLGGIEWSRRVAESTDGTLSSDWVQQPDGSFAWQGDLASYSNYIWIGNPQDPSMFNAFYPVAVAEDGAAIVGMFAVDEGLLVLTSSVRGQSGVVLLRGNPADYWADPLDDGLSREFIAALDVSYSDGLINDASCYWPAQKSVLFVTTDSKLYQYRNGLVSEIGPDVDLPDGDAVVDVRRRLRTQARGGGVAAFGEFVVFRAETSIDGSASRSNQWFAMRAIGDEGVWTELNIPLPHDDFNTPYEQRPLQTYGLSMFANENGAVVAHWAQYPFGNFLTTYIGIDSLPSGSSVQDPYTAEDIAALDEAGVPHDLTNPSERYSVPAARLVTQPLASDSPHVEKWWHQVGVVLSRIGRTGALKSVTTSTVTPDGERVEYRVELNAELPRNRSEFVVPAFGPGLTCSIEVEVEGDVEIHQLTAWFDRAGEQW